MADVVVFGSSGQTGVWAVDAAVQKGLKVRAFVRKPTRLVERLRNHANVEVFTGDVTNYDDVSKAVKGVKAVTIILGTRDNHSPELLATMSVGTIIITKAMRAHKVEVVSVCLAYFLFHTLDHKPEKVPVEFEDVNDQHLRMYNIVRWLHLNCIAVLPPIILDSPLGDFETTDHMDPKHFISKRTLGKFLIDSLFQPEYYGKTIGIYDKK